MDQIRKVSGDTRGGLFTPRLSFCPVVFFHRTSFIEQIRTVNQINRQLKTHATSPYFVFDFSDKVNHYLLTVLFQ